MGLIPTMFRASSSELTPVVPPVGVYREHIAAHPVSLVLREKGWSMSGVSDMEAGAGRGDGQLSTGRKLPG